MFFVLAALAQSPPAPQVSEEIFVWQQPFSRFDDKRWLVRSEVVSPTFATVGSVKSPIRANAWQLEAVVDCQLADNRGKLREVECRVEDAALRVHTPDGRAGSRQDRAMVELAQSLVGANLQLQVNRKGRVVNMDLDGLPEGNLEERRVVDGVRMMMAQVSNAFQMDFPDEDPRGRVWNSKREPLLLVAAPTQGMGSVRVQRRLDSVDGNWIQQTRGRSVSTAVVPNPDAGIPRGRSAGITGLQSPLPAISWAAAGARPYDIRSRWSGTGRNNRVRGWSLGSATGQPYSLGMDFTYALEMAAVSVVDLERGYPTERVWTVRGQPTASSPGSVTGTSYWSAGVLRELAVDEGVELGNSGFIGAPNEEHEDLDDWVSVTPVS